MASLGATKDTVGRGRNGLSPACVACRRFSRGYLRHLFQAEEVLGPTLVSLHNVTYYQTLMRGAREALREGTWAAFRERTLAPYAPEAGSGLAPGEARE